MLKINTQFLSTLRHRFDEQISESDILAWLYNFEEADWETALMLLNKVSFYSENRCCNILKEGLSFIIKQNNNKPLIFLPIGGIGKSGGVMAYYVKKIMDRINKNYVFAKETYQFEDHSSIIILLDDFIGSGKSALTLYEKISDKIPKNSVCYCLCVAYMDKAGKKLAENGIDILGDAHLPAFARRHSIFGYPPKMKRIKDFAMKYGNLLYKKKNYVLGMNLYIGPLGYANSQSLVCFVHTTPNNTLPILWESKKRSDHKGKWIPLFPRKIGDRILRDETFERSKYQWASIAQKINSGTINLLFNSYKKSTLQLLGLIHCLYYKRSAVYTCNLLEITSDELNLLQQSAIEKGLLCNNGTLSDEGKNIYERIKKESFKVNPLVYNQKDYKKDVYLPNKFLGLSRN